MSRSVAGTLGPRDSIGNARQISRTLGGIQQVRSYLHHYFLGVLGHGSEVADSGDRGEDVDDADVRFQAEILHPRCLGRMLEERQSLRRESVLWVEVGQRAPELVDRSGRENRGRGSA